MKQTTATVLASGLVALLAGCRDETLTAILPAPVVVVTNDASLDVEAETGEADAPGEPDAIVGVDGEGGLTTKISSLVVHDTNADRFALWSVQHDFEIGVNGVYPWGDWPKTYIVSMDAAAIVLLRKDYIAVASESKQYTGGPQATVTFAAPADLYMIFDDRWMTPAWIQGWTDTGWNMIVWESVNRPSLAFSVLMRSVPAGPLDLPLIGDTTGYNYVIVVN
jgi:hypothetical protein